MELTFGELFEASPSASEVLQKKISNRRVSVDSVKSTNSGAMEEEDEQDQLTHYSFPLGYVRLTINGQTHEALLDTGSMVNIIPEELARCLGLVITEKPMWLKGIGGHHTEITGIAEGVEVLIGKVTKPVHLRVSKGGVQFIIGEPFLMDVSATINRNEDREE